MPAAIPIPAFRRALCLGSARLVSSAPWRFAKVIGIILAISFTFATIYLSGHGLGHQVHPIVARTAVLIAWLGGAVIALWNAGDRAKADHLDGIDALARTHGIDPHALIISRFLAVALRVTALVMLTCLPVVIASIAVSPSFSDALKRTLSLLPLAGFATAVGLVTGPLAGTCGWLAPRHGRSCLAVVVFIPWFLDGLGTTSHAGSNSILGLLGTLADLVTRVGTS